MHFIAIDPGIKRTGIARVDGDKIETSIIEPDKDIRLTSFTKLLSAEIQAYSPEFVVYEDISYGGHRSAAQADPYVLIKLSCEYTETPVISIPIMVWKALTIGTRVKKGPGYLSAVKQLYGKDFETDDEADAYMIALAVLQIHNRRITTPGAAKFRDALTKLRKSVTL